MIITLASIILLLPLVTFAVMALAHHKLPRHGDWLATAAIGVSFLLSVVLFLTAAGQAIGGSTSTLLADWTFTWLPMSTTAALKAGIMVDRLTAVMLVVVTLISLLVHLFSVKYMEDDVRYGRYYCCLLLFTFSMLMLVLADNMLFLYMGWEMVGLSSYLLIGHWF
jgi:NADH-quinone oxidoreductase subunit L